jgi:hypothetical protein
MTQVVEKQTFIHHGLYRLPPLLENLELRRRTFESCQHPAQKRLRDRPVLRNVKLLRCHVDVSDLGPVIAEDCLIDTIWFHRGKWGPQAVSGCALRHVTIMGNITGGLRFLPSPLWIQWQWEYLSGKKRRAEKAQKDTLEQRWQRALRAEGPLRGSLPSRVNRFARANTRFYANVDWALDISDARFTGVELCRSGIPHGSFGGILRPRQSCTERSYLGQAGATCSLIALGDSALSAFLRPASTTQCSSHASGDATLMRRWLAYAASEQPGWRTQSDCGAESGHTLARHGTR